LDIYILQGNVAT